MKREPDWEALADLQFLLYNRIADSLNAALSGIALSDMPEAQDKPPGYWKERASTKVANVLNLFTAWSYLIRFKMGEIIPDRAVRPFETNTLLKWMGNQLQIIPPPQIPSNPLLYANQETLQEALLLLYSVAYTQGSGVRLEMEGQPGGLWFRVQFMRNRPLPTSLDDFLASLGSHWREQDTAFELATARDFIRLNNSELALNSTDTHGEFAFFVRSAAAARAKTGPLTPPATKRPAAVAKPSATEIKKPGILEAPKVEPQFIPQAKKTSVALEVNTTPVLPPDETPEVQPAVPPTLAQLRPRAPSIPSPAAEGAAPPGEPASPQPGEPSTIQAADTHLSAPTPIIPLTPPKSGGLLTPVPAPRVKTSPNVIVPAKIPAPSQPRHLRTPPASTSNVALTKETQTLDILKADSSPAPAESPQTVETRDASTQEEAP